MARSAIDARRWMADGTELFVGAAHSVTDADYDAPTLPGWTRRNLVAHVAANAEAIGNLIHWAATSERTPMYASPQERAEGIERGASMTAADLDAWLRASTAALAEAMDALTDAQWATEVVTAQGRTVPASETLWMRSREVYIHAVDLGTGITFADLPTDFLTSLIDDITAKRGTVPAIVGPLPERAAWLAGRPHSLAEAPDLDPWL